MNKNELTHVVVLQYLNEIDKTISDKRLAKNWFKKRTQANF